MLGQVRGGDKDALATLLPLVYDELKRVAASHLRRERPDHTLQATALVHEMYVRLVDRSALTWENRAHFFGVAAQAMRQILVDHARSRGASKRGGQRHRVTLDEALAVSAEPSIELLAIDEALIALAELDPAQARLVELRYFGGLTVEETAEVLDVSPTTVKREWRLAKAWLHRRLSVAP